MKITIMNATAHDVARVPALIEQYWEAGYANGSRPRQRDCAIYSRSIADRRSAYVWGGPEHIRVAFPLIEEPTP